MDTSDLSPTDVKEGLKFRGLCSCYPRKGDPNCTGFPESHVEEHYRTADGRRSVRKP